LLRDRIGALERRVSELSRAAVRISASLDLDAVLREVVDSARALPRNAGRNHDLSLAAPPDVDQAGRNRQTEAGPRRREDAPPQSGRGRIPRDPDPQRARARIPHARTGERRVIVRRGRSDASTYET